MMRATLEWVYAMKQKISALGALVAALFSLAALPASAGPEEAPGVARPDEGGEAGEQEGAWIVAIVEDPPYAMRGEAGGWDGLGAHLWADVAAARGIGYRWRAYDNEGAALEALERGDVAAVVAATVSAEGGGALRLHRALCA